VILLKKCNLVSLDESLNQIEYGIDVLIDEDRIVQIGKDIKIKKEKVKVIDCLNKYVLPGLINCHTHIPMSLFREIVDGYALQDWLEKAI
jgi:5-methylthioadenosine/S-adenosylhomocysteine deaminase